MGTLTKIKGKVTTTEIQTSEIAGVSDPKKTLVYHPNYNGEAQVFWGKLFNNSVILSSYEDNTPVGTERIENLRKLIFIQKGTNKVFNLKYTQWKKRIDYNEIDIVESMEAVVCKDGIVRVVPRKEIGLLSMANRLSKGTSSAGEMLDIIRMNGYKLVPMDESNNYAS